MLTSRRLIVLFAIACLAAWSTQALAHGVDRDAGRAAADREAPIVLPATPPRPDAAVSGAYGYHGSRWFSRQLNAGSHPGPASSQGGGSATVTITATVLPVRTIVVRGGAVVQVWGNLPGTDPRASLYQVRLGSISGPQAALTPATWAQARVLLAHAHAGPGKLASL